jgi:hypothetical protein
LTLMNLHLTPVVRKTRGRAEVEMMAKVALPRRLRALELC